MKFVHDNAKKIETYNRRFNAALEMVNAGFFTKSAKKECNDLLGRCYDMIREDVQTQTCDYGHAMWDSWGAEKNEWFAAHDLPFGLHQYREAKHSKMCFEWHEEIMRLVALRDTAKEMEIGQKPETQSEIEKKAEKESKEAFDDGFRTSFGISWMSFDCRSVLGNYFVRTFWYKSGQLKAFNTIMCDVQTQVAVWKKQGKPNMSGWDYKDIRAFYKKHNALI